MAQDDKLTQRFYEALGRRDGISERNMMGGVCFVLNGNMIGGADRHAQTHFGRFMFRVGKARQAQALTIAGTAVFEQGGRLMGGMIFMGADTCRDADLKLLASLALEFVETLPAK